MGLFMLIINIVNLFAMIPEIYRAIKTIMELIKMLKDEQRTAAKEQLKTVLKKYIHIDKKNKEQVKTSSSSLLEELKALEKDLKEKTESV